MTQTEKFNDFIASFDKANHLLYAKGELVSADIAETIFLYGVKGNVFEIVNFADRKTVKKVIN
jgi:hypothetical protein